MFRSSSLSLTVVATILQFAMPLPASAQIKYAPAYNFYGDSESWFGISVSGAGDVNGDGVPDFIVGAIRADVNGEDSGSAFVYSGLDGSSLHSFNGDTAGDLFGGSVSGAGDVNNDGFADLVVGASFAHSPEQDSGIARVFSGLDGSTLYTFSGSTAFEQFGASVSAAGDVNIDGSDDILVGAWHAENDGEISGRAFIYSGLDGSTLHTFSGEPGENFGAFVSGAHDVNDDGYPDVIVGAAANEFFGLEDATARVFSGVDGSVLHTFAGDSEVDFHGFTVGAAGDVNNDGFDDLIVGAYSDDHNGDDSGIVRVYSGINGAVLHTFYASNHYENFGNSVDGMGDVNNDGFGDVLCGTFMNGQDGMGYVRIFSGADGSILHTIRDNVDFTSFGRSAACAGDVNNDGYPDLIVGAAGDETFGNNSGRAVVLVSTCLGDLNADLAVDVFDLLGLLEAWDTEDYLADLNNDEIVDIFDLLDLLDLWGPTSCGPAKEE